LRFLCRVGNENAEEVWIFSENACGKGEHLQEGGGADDPMTFTQEGGGFVSGAIKKKGKRRGASFWRLGLSSAEKRMGSSRKGLSTTT